MSSAIRATRGSGPYILSQHNLVFLCLHLFNTLSACMYQNNARYTTCDQVALLILLCLHATCNQHSGPTPRGLSWSDNTAMRNTDGVGDFYDSMVR